jgi:FkbM family methyltransferase
MKDTSQYGEARFIAEHFAGRIGRFLDVGAFDGVTFSNTRPLAELGWQGVCIEPSPPAFCHLMRNYEGNENVKLVNAAVMASLSEGRVHKFLSNTADAQSADALSTFDPAHREIFFAYPFREIYVPVIQWTTLTRTFGDLFDFVNVDVEGANADVLQAMPFRAEMVCVEVDKNKDGTRAERTLLNWGYKVKMIGGNALGVRA